MALNESPRPIDKYVSQVHTVLESPRVDDAFFASVGEVTAGALFRHDVQTTNRLVEKVYKFSEPALLTQLPTATADRLMGNFLMMASGAAFFRKKEAPNPLQEGANASLLSQEKRHNRFKEMFNERIDSVLSTNKVDDFNMLAFLTATAIIEADQPGLDFAHKQLKWLQHETQASAETQNQLIGIFDVLTPALDRFQVLGEQQISK